MSVGSTLSNIFRTLARGTTPAGSPTSVAIDANVQALHVVAATGANVIGSVKLTDGTNPVAVSTANELFVTAKDILLAAQSITAQDIVSTTVAGANAQNIVTGTPTAGSFAAITVGGDSSFSIQISGTWTGTMAFERSLDAGVTYTPIGAFSAGTSFITQTVTQNGAFHGNAASATNIRVRSTGTFTGSASVRLLAGNGGSTITIGNPLRLFDKSSGAEHSIKAASTAAVASDTALVVGFHPSTPTPTGTNTIGSVGLTASSVSIGARADGYLRTVADPTTLLFDTFETLDTTNTWTLNGTVAPTGANGVLTINASTTASATSYAVSKPIFTPGSSAYLQFASICTIQTGTVTGVNQFFGLSTVSSPTVSVPIQNGTIFELDTTGALLGSVYSSGVRTQTVSLTKPVDGAPHRFAIYYKASRVYFEIDNIQVGSLPFPNPSVAALSCSIGQINSATITGTPTLNATLIGLGDTARNATKMADGLYPWRTATVKPASAAPVATDTALVVAISPNSPTPTGSNAIGSIDFTNAGVVSSSNSSAVNLGANAIFTGPSEDISAYSQATVGIFANQNSAIDGLSLQFSPDGTNWDYNDNYTITASQSKNITLGVHAKFFRIVYTNGATATTAFRLHTMYHKVAQAPSSNRPSDSRTNETDTQDISAFGMAWDAASALWQRVRMSTKGIQASSAIATQNLKDSGRVAVNITAYRAAGIITTEALFAAATFSSTRDGAAATTGQQFTVTAGKRFRIQSIQVSLFGNAAAATTSKLALRYQAAGGTIATTSPIAAVYDLGSNNATTGNYMGPFNFDFPDGLEFISGSTFGFTNLASAATVLHTITLVGFEY